MKFLVARRKTMYVFHASGQSFALNLLDPEAEAPDFRPVTSLRLPTGQDLGYDLRACFSPQPQCHGSAVRNS